MKKKEEIWLNLGCGVSLADRPFVNIDNFFTLDQLKDGIKRKDPAYVNARVPKDVKFIKASMTALPYQNETVDYVECNDAIEHLSWNEVDVALREIYRVLKPGCKLGLATTNFDELAKLWTLNITGNNLSTQLDIDRYVSLAKIIYGNQVHEGEFHRVPFNPYSIAFRLKEAGFDLKKITIDIFPTGSPTIIKSKAYAHHAKSLEGTFVATEGMWVEAIK
jgi:SAM-dependent methyltransferase